MLAFVIQVGKSGLLDLLVLAQTVECLREVAKEDEEVSLCGVGRQIPSRQ